MLRTLYGLILRAHPPFFRRRFEEEMQCIFELAETPRDQIGMLADAVVSLARQWTLRPRFWEEQVLPAAAQAGQLFSSLDNHKPRAVALLYGALLSAMVLNGICWTMGYAWNHPIFIEFRRPRVVPPASRNQKTTETSKATETAGPELYTNEGRVVLIFTMHPHAGKPALTGNAPASSVPAALPSAMSKTPTHLLYSYVGTYISSPGQEKVNVALANGVLQLEVVGAFRSRLQPSANLDSMSCSERECQVSFSAGASGNVDGLHIRYGQKEVQAFRLQGAIF